MSTALEPQAGAETSAPAPGGGTAIRVAGDWARRAPLLPALIFMIVVTQLPFVGTLIVSFMNWNAYYPDDIGFAGLANFGNVLTDPGASTVNGTPLEMGLNRGDQSGPWHVSFYHYLGH